MGPESFVLGGSLFYLGLLLAKTVLNIPFDLYRTFSIEERYQFNTTSASLWLSDVLKSTLLLLLGNGLLSAAALWLIQNSPDWWWLWVWGLLVAFTLLLMVISSRLLEPLFFTFSPISRPDLEAQIRRLAASTGIIATRVRQVDASRRSRHANAYFTGLGRQKRIVLFDTLLRQLNDHEVIAVLAHEIGHWRLHHLRWRLLLGVLASLIVSALAFLTLRNNSLAQWFGHPQISFAAQTVYFGLLCSLAASILRPLINSWSRHHERQADRFACGVIEQPQSLASALAKMAENNLSFPCPHPLFAWVYCSHPPLSERIKAIAAKRQNETDPARC